MFSFKNVSINYWYLNLVELINNKRFLAFANIIGDKNSMNFAKTHSWPIVFGYSKQDLLFMLVVSDLLRQSVSFDHVFSMFPIAGLLTSFIASPSAFFAGDFSMSSVAVLFRSLISALFASTITRLFASLAASPSTYFFAGSLGQVLSL